MTENDNCIYNIKNSTEYVANLIAEIHKKFEGGYHSRVMRFLFSSIDCFDTLKTLDGIMLVAKSYQCVADISHEMGIKSESVTQCLIELYASGFINIDGTDPEDLLAPFTVSFICNSKTLELKE